MFRHLPHLVLVHVAAEAGHSAVAVAAAIPDLPGRELRFDIGSALAANGGYAGPSSAALAMAGRALDRIEPGACDRGIDRPPGHMRQRGIVSRNGEPFIAVERPCDRPHLLMNAKSLDVVRQLPDEIALVEPGKPGRQGTIAFTLQSMTGHAGALGSRITAGQGDDLTACTVPSGSSGVTRACTEQQSGKNGGQLHRRWNRFGETAVPSAMHRGSIFGMVAVAAALEACKPPPDDRYQRDPEAARRGKAVIERVQCGSCHVVPGIDWPTGKLGPSLERIDQQGFIAGTLPNTPENLAAFIRNAPGLKPGTVMPPMPIDEREARDVAQYLIAEDNR
jgi:mono/diheme cytochrome c family protein